MEHVMEQAPSGAAEDSARWKHTAASVSAILLGLIFLVSGGWKVLDPFRAGELLEQAKVAAGYGVPGAVLLGAIELVAAALLFVPSLRKMGGLLGSGLILFFLGWVAYYYSALAGKECSCFPLIKRTIGPGFFVGDGVMLLFGLAAFAWSSRVKSLKIPAIVFTSVFALTAVSFVVNAQMRGKAQVPNPVIVDGKPSDLTNGKVLIFFYDPSCMHCDAAAKFMSKMDWETTRVVALPTVNPQWAAAFLHDTGLKAGTSLELKKLKDAFPFIDPPYGVALVDGRVKGTFGQAQFTPPLPKADLEKLGFVK